MHVLDPLHGLLLGVDAERETTGGGREDAVLDRVLVGRQAFRGPILYNGVARQERLEVEVRRDGDVEGGDLRVAVASTA